MSSAPSRYVGPFVAAALCQGCVATAQEPSLTATIWPSQRVDVANVPERGSCVFLPAGTVDAAGGRCAAEGHLAGRPSFGLAFSGGGNRSAAAEIGELRALGAL